MSIVKHPVTFINHAPDDKEWTAHINILNDWTEPDRYLRQIIQVARGGKHYPADMHVDLIEQVMAQQMAQTPPHTAADIEGHGSDLWPEVEA